MDPLTWKLMNEYGLDLGQASEVTEAFQGRKPMGPVKQVSRPSGEDPFRGPARNPTVQMPPMNVAPPIEMPPMNAARKPFAMPPMIVDDERKALRDAYLAKISKMPNARPHWVEDYDAYHEKQPPKAPVVKRPKQELKDFYTAMASKKDHPRADFAKNVLEGFKVTEKKWKTYDSSMAAHTSEKAEKK